MTTHRRHDPDEALRHLCCGPASSFGARLLARARGPLIEFQDFVHTARDMIRGEPEATATWLAALVALDMRARDQEPPPPRRPSPSPN